MGLIFNTFKYIALKTNEALAAKVKTHHIRIQYLPT